tara:strand:- start:240 stop:416 length:177 start_codon:yes stop_codon:yes gene_type:complete
MNKKTAIKIKRAMNYSDTAEQKRVYNAIKKQYNGLSAKEKNQLIIDLEKTFKNERESS